MKKPCCRCKTVSPAERIRIPPDEARDLAKRALLFKKERGRLPDMNAPDP
ncbi:hypothetical protein OURE66S_02625 [Oligella ureolytica]